MKINGVEFNEQELKFLGVILDNDGDVNVAVTILVGFADNLREGIESVADYALGDLVLPAIENLLSWYSDMHGVPVEEAAIAARTAAVMQALSKPLDK